MRTNGNAGKLFCKRGHPFYTANTYINPKGERQCRECKRLWGQKKYAEDEKYAIARRAKRKTWGKKNPDREAMHKRKTKYGLTNEEYNAMLEKQKGRCAICEEAAPLDVDHDHKTSKVRGLLCGKHNKGIGLFSDDPKLLREAIAYLERAAH